MLIKNKINTNKIKFENCLALPPCSNKILGLILTYRCSGGLSPWPLCVEFACFPCAHMGSLRKEPQYKNMQNRLLSRSGHGWVPRLGPQVLLMWLPTVPGCPGRKNSRVDRLIWWTPNLHFLFLVNLNSQHSLVSILDIILITLRQQYKTVTVQGSFD